MSDYSLILPPDFECYAPEQKDKGWFEDAILDFSGMTYQLHFFDPVRLAQAVRSDVEGTGVFFEPNVVVVQSITKKNMLEAVERLIKFGMVSDLVPQRIDDNQL
jgi:hypothetical protein